MHEKNRRIKESKRELTNEEMSEKPGISYT